MSGPKGWLDDDLDAALDAYLKTCEAVGLPTYRGGGARAFFESAFNPGEATPAFFTGYFEPDYPASRIRTAEYCWPIHAAPPSGSPMFSFTRAEIMGGALDEEGLALFWLSDPMDAFMLGVQGSGRLSLPDGKTARVNFAGRNAHAYRSIGQALIARGEIDEADMSAEALRQWVHENGEEGLALLAENPAYVFLRELHHLAETDGPVGAMGAPLTAGRSAAIDPEFAVMGAPIWVEPPDERPRLVIAQDTGSAIKGRGRIDLYIGSGREAGRIAGAIRDDGRVTPLLPRTVD